MTDSSLYQQAATLIQSGNYAKGEQLLTDHLKSQPTDEIATSILASSYLKQDQNDSAIELLKSNMDKHPASYAAAADLGFAYLKSDHIADAIAAFGQATDLKPDFYLGWVQRAKLSYQQGDYAQALQADAESEKYDPLDQGYQQLQMAMQQNNRAGAEQIARQMLQRQAGHPRAAFFLAHLADTVGAHEQAADILNHGLDFHPANVQLRRALVESYEKTGQYQQAYDAVCHLTEIQATYYNYWLKSRIAGHLADFVEALAAAEQAATYLDPASAERGKVDLLRGHALKILGRRTESETAYQACIKNTPDNGAGWWGLADLKTYQFSDQDISMMQKLAENENIEPDQRCQSAFALAKAYENNGDPDTAIHWYLQANSLRPDITFDPEKHADYFNILKTAYTGLNTTTQAAPIPTGPTPVFIVGMPRAGSTLIEQILASHSQIEGTMELMTMVHLERHLKITYGPKYKKKYPAVINDLTASELSQLGQKYLDDSALFRTGAPYFIDKLPPNFERIGLIHKILPQAIIIDARRHPMDCGYSAFKQHFASGHDYSYNLSHIGAYYNAYLDLMDFWRSQLGGAIVTVQHEDMLANPEQTITDLLSALNLDFEQSCLDFHKNKRSVKTASSEQVRQPINTKGMGVWRQVEEALTPLKDSLGEVTLQRFENLPLGAGKR